MKSNLASPALACLLIATSGWAEVREFPGGTPVPHEKYIRVVSEVDSPVEKAYIRAKDGLHVAAAIRKPKGPGPFPALIQFHGAPGGQGMDPLVSWVRGESGGPLWERYLQEGFVVIAADYRGGERRESSPGPSPDGVATRLDDGLAVIEHVRQLPFIDPNRINLYGGSLGGGLVLQLITRTKVHAAGVGAPAAYEFLGISRAPRETKATDYWKNGNPNLELAKKNVAAIQCPLLIQVGSTDNLVSLARPLHDLMTQAGKPVRLEIYANSPHGFYFGRLRKDESRPVYDSTVAALDSAVAFMRQPVR